MFRVEAGGKSWHMFQNAVFDHLWVLWYRCWLVVAFAWRTSLGLIGLFQRFFSGPSWRLRWLADVSYWMDVVPYRSCVRYSPIGWLLNGTCDLPPPTSPPVDTIVVHMPWRS